MVYLLEHFILLFLDFSLTDWASQVGAELAGNLPGKFVKILLQHLGLDVKLNNPPCDSNSEKYSPAQHGWKSGEYLSSYSPCDSYSEKYSSAQYGWKSGEYLSSYSPCDSYSEK